MKGRLISLLMFSGSLSVQNVANAAPACGQILDPYTDTIVLPIKLLEFNARLQGDVVHVYWTTNNEIEATRFVVERSTDGRVFKTVGEMQPTVRSGIQDYHYSDDNAVEQKSTIVYYRLRQRGQDNHSVYSRVLVVELVAKSEISCYPNPAHDELGVVIPASRPGKLSLQVIDASGKSLITQTRSVDSGVNSFGVNISLLKPGTYYLLLTGMETIYQRLFLKN